MYVHCSYMSVLLHNHTSFPIRPDQPCDAGESPHRAGAAPSEQPQYTCINTVHTLYIYCIYTAYTCTYHVHDLHLGICSTTNVFSTVNSPVLASACDIPC